MMLNTSSVVRCRKEMQNIVAIVPNSFTSRIKRNLQSCLRESSYCICFVGPLVMSLDCAGAIFSLYANLILTLASAKTPMSWLLEVVG